MQARTVIPHLRLTPLAPIRTAGATRGGLYKLAPPSAAFLHTSSPRLHDTAKPLIMSQFTVPKTQKAAIVESTSAPLKVVDNFPVKQPEDLAPGECLVQLDVSGVCHTDLHASKGDWPIPAKLPLIGGHEVSQLALIAVP